MKAVIYKIIGDEKRQAYTIPLLAILASLVVASLLFLIMGHNPLTAYQAILRGAGLMPRPSYAAGRGMLTDIMLSLAELTPMILASLAVVVALKGGLFNIGVAGQMLFSGYMATVLIGYSTLPAYWAMPLVLLIGAASGALVGAIIGFLKDRFNINEVVSSIMFNYIIQFVTTFFILGNYVDPVTRQSRDVAPAARLVFQNVPVGPYRTALPVFIILAIVAAFALRFFIKRTRSGFDLCAVGANLKAARYLGISPSLNIMLAMTLSGALAGLAGVTYYLGLHASIPLRDLPNMGFDAIAVALLGNASPLGALFASCLITVISRGSTYMSSLLNVQREIAQVMTGLILLFAACGAYLRKVVRDQ